jgi:signal transduction histidine kinase/CheY-like chemotaxis protein
MFLKRKAHSQRMRSAHVFKEAQLPMALSNPTQAQPQQSVASEVSLLDRARARLTLRELGRKEILLINLMFGLLALLVFSRLPGGPFDSALVLPMVGLFLVFVAATLFFDNTDWTAHIMLGTTFGALAWAIYGSGAINSPFMVWMHITPVVALLTLGMRWAAVWVVLTLLHNLIQYAVVTQGWVSGEVPKNVIPIPVAVGLNLHVVFYLVLAVILYDLFYAMKKRRLEQRTWELEDIRHALRKAKVDKDLFVASMGHELRTPMNAIMGLNSILLDEMNGQADFASAALHIRESATQMLGVVNNILDIAQLEADRLRFHSAPCSLRATLDACIEPFYRRAVLKGLSFESTIEAGPDLWVMTDHQRLAQVIASLLDNAVKFTDHGGIEIRVSRTDITTRVEVHDTGCGIQAQDTQAIFDRFAHGFETTRSALTGAGLSLALCQYIVLNQGGSLGLGAKSTPGTLIWFEWPMENCAPVVEASVAATRTASKTPNPSWRFLAVDDHPMNLTVVELSLQRIWPQAKVDTASSGKQALARLAATHYDAVLMDVLMPDMDGMETTRRIRANPDARIQKVPVLGLTAYHHGDTLAKCLAAGMQAVLTKPIESGQLRAQLERLLGQTASVCV